MFICLRAMHNISTSDIQPVSRRRCSSEGKRQKSRPRPVSAVIYPLNRRRSGTEPSSSPEALFHAGSSNSTRNLSEGDSSPRSKTPSVLNRLLPRRRSKEGKFAMLLITQVLFDYRKLPLMSPKLVRLRKGFWTILINWRAYKRNKNTVSKWATPVLIKICFS